MFPGEGIVQALQDIVLGLKPNINQLLERSEYAFRQIGRHIDLQGKKIHDVFGIYDGLPLIPNGLKPRPNGSGSLLNHSLLGSTQDVIDLERQLHDTFMCLEHFAGKSAF